MMKEERKERRMRKRKIMFRKNEKRKKSEWCGLKVGGVIWVGVK